MIRSKKVSIASKEEKEAKERQELLRPLEMDDLPETLLKLEPEVLERLNQLRSQKIEAELVLKKRYTEMNDSINHLRYVETEAKQNILQETALRQQLEEAQEELQRTSWDAQLMIALKQGQDEVYVRGELNEFESAHAMLVNRAVIENENVAIRAKGADKKSVLNKNYRFPQEHKFDGMGTQVHRNAIKSPGRALHRPAHVACEAVPAGISQGEHPR